MGYRIEYQPINPVRHGHIRRTRVGILTGLCFLLFLFLVTSFWPQGRDLLRELLIPGDPDVTMMALETFAGELRRGVTFSNAAESFCRILMEPSFYAAS